MKKGFWIIFSVTLMAVMACSCAPSGDQEHSATVVEVVNKVDAHPRPKDDWQPAAVDMAIYGGGQVRTGAASSARLELLEGMVRLAAESILTVKESATRQERLVTALFLQEGRLWAHLTTSQPHDFTVETGSAVAAVRDTRFSVRVGPDQTTLVSVAEGEVVLTAQGVSVTVAAGQQATVESGQPPGQPEPMSDEENALWATEGEMPELAPPTPTPTIMPAEAAPDIAYELVDIPAGRVEEYGAWEDVVSILSVDKGARDGAILVKVVFSASCAEEYRYSWEFDRDTSQLRPGDRFVVTAHNELMTASCADLDASSLFIRGNMGVLPSKLIEDRLTPETEPHFGGNTGSLYAKRGPTSQSAEMGIEENAKGPFQWFEVQIYPGYGAGAIRYHVVYWYAAGQQEGGPPARPEPSG
jgi:hypothetical protein